MSSVNSKNSVSRPGFRSVPRTGVIYVMTEALRHGYRQGSPDWANWGQGAPETGELAGSPERISELKFELDALEYAPVDGLLTLRQAVADLYNERYRRGKSSKYGVENIAISSGGRLGLTRLISTVGRTHVGHFLPDYTAYEELLDAFGTFVPIPLQLDPAKGYALSAEELSEKILGLGLSAVLLSNPCNPTGRLISGDLLKAWIDTARNLHTTLIFDEFYSHYIYGQEMLSVSAAEHVQDVNEDGVIIIDGLTKNWRYPGFRVSWTLGPKDIIEGVASAGSFLDGGCARPLQLASIPLVKKEVADAEARAIQKHFSAKREFLLNGLRSLGIRVDPAPSGSFYCWGDLSELPSQVNSGTKLFKKCMEVGLITVPGEFFDINPGHRRPDRPSRFKHYTRFSFGPSMEELERGFEKIRMVIDYSARSVNKSL